MERHLKRTITVEIIARQNARKKQNWNIADNISEQKGNQRPKFVKFVAENLDRLQASTDIVQLNVRNGRKKSQNVSKICVKQG